MSFYEMSCYEMSFYEMSCYEMSFYEMSCYEMSFYEIMSCYEMFFYEISFVEMFFYRNVSRPKILILLFKGYTDSVGMISSTRETYVDPLLATADDINQDILIPVYERAEELLYTWR